MLLVDIEMPYEVPSDAASPAGIALTHRLFMELPHIRVVLLSWHYKNAYIAAAIRAGAAGYVIKGGDQNQLIRAVTAAKHGDFFVECEVVLKFREIVSGILDPRSPADLFAAEKLTGTENTILGLVAHNRTNEQIATELHLAAQTVRNYISSILAKLAVPDRQAAQTLYRQRAQAVGLDFTTNE